MVYCYMGRVIASSDAEVYSQLYFILAFPAWARTPELLRNCVVRSSKWLFCVKVHSRGKRNNGALEDYSSIVSAGRFSAMKRNRIFLSKKVAAMHLCAIFHSHFSPSLLTCKKLCSSFESALLSS